MSHSPGLRALRRMALTSGSGSTTSAVLTAKGRLSARGAVLINSLQLFSRGESLIARRSVGNWQIDQMPTTNVHSAIGVPHWTWGVRAGFGFELAESEGAATVSRFN
jgi:hypothetical protein